VKTRAPAASAGPEADTGSDGTAGLQREWWLRVLMTLPAPRFVFQAMRDDAHEAASARQEPALALIFLSGIAAVLSFSPVTKTLLDNPERDGLLVAVLVFLGGGIYGFAGYWLGGGALHLGMRGAKAESSYRQARHLLAYSLTPLALSLLTVWPVRLVAFGGDNFRTGGADDGTAYWIFTGVELAFLAWSLALLVYGVRHLQGWTIVHTVGALVLTAMAMVGLALLVVLVGG
jgi:hypothetical protein